MYNNPAVVIATDYQVAYSHLEYKYLELVLDEPFLARSLRFNATLEDQNITDAYSDDYAKFAIAPSPKIQEIEVYSKSIPEKDISESFYIESSKDGSVYNVHYDVDILSTTSAKYTVGRPVKSLKLHIESSNKLSVYDIRGIFSENNISLKANYGDFVALNPSTKSPELSVEEIEITNDGSSTSNFYVDIFDNGTQNDRCLLWSKLSSDDAISQSEIGPGGIICRREYRNLRPYNYAYNCPGYFLDKYFFYGSISYVSRDGGVSWCNIGSVITDGSDSTYITNENSLFHKYHYIYVALDLGSNYDIDSVSMFSGGLLGFSPTILYSQLDSSNPSDIPFDTGNPNGWRSSSVSNGMSEGLLLSN